MKHRKPAGGKIITRVRNRAWCAECIREIAAIDQRQTAREMLATAVEIERQEREAPRLPDVTDKAEALTFLQGAGIVTADGKLSERFGGEPEAPPPFFFTDDVYLLQKLVRGEV